MPRRAAACVPRETCTRPIVEMEGRPAKLPRDARERALGQRPEVARPLEQGRQTDGEHGQPVVQVLAEATRAHLLGEIAIGGGDDAHVDLDNADATHALEAPLMQDAQKLGLKLWPDLRHLVEVPSDILECDAAGRNGPLERTTRQAVPTHDFANGETPAPPPTVPAP